MKWSLLGVAYLDILVQIAAGRVDFFIPTHLVLLMSMETFEIWEY